MRAPFFNFEPLTLPRSEYGRRDVTLYHVLLFVHILLGVVWIGGIVHSEAQIIAAERSRDPVRVVDAYVGLAAVNRKLFLIPSWAVTGFGIWLVVETNRSFTELWIILAMVGSLLAAGVGLVVLAGEGMRISRMVREGRDREVVLARIFRLSRLRKVHTLVLVGVLALMIWKPA